MIYFVTGNKGKHAEARAIFGDLVQKDIGYTEIQADTLEEVAAYGIKEVSFRLDGPVMIEDAGFRRAKFTPMTGGVVALHSGWKL